MKTNSKSTSGPSRRVLSTLLFAAALAAVIGAVASSRAVGGSDSHDQSAIMSKIAPWVSEHTANGQQAEFMVVLTDQADLRPAASLATKNDKSRYVYDALRNKSQTTQGPILQWLQERGIEHRSFHIINAILVKGSREIAETLAARPDVARVEGNPHIQNSLPQPGPALEGPLQPGAPATIEPGIVYTHAPDVWALGFHGENIVVASADTGVRWTHNALKPHYRGWDGVTADHDYNWHDSIHDSVGNPCGNDSPFPCDDYFHGSHTTGTAIGDDGAGNQIGMAPGAKWIGCRNMDQGNGTPARYIECMEWFLAPYPISGGQGDPTKAPDITINSWSCPPSEGCSANTLQAAVEAQAAAGIMMVAAAQNYGSGCSTVEDPPGIYDASYTVGALNTGTDTIASFSSRGPVTIDGSGRIKPDITAPGTNTRSATNTSDSAYTIASGTSMATPHIAGAMALLWSAIPSLQNQIDASSAALNSSAVFISSTQCGAAGPPNNVFGWGRVDALAAVQVLSLTGAVSRTTHGTAGTFDVPLPLTGEPGVECRSTSGRFKFVFTFSSNVVSGSAAVTSGTGRVAGSPIFSGNTMTVNLKAVTDIQKITVTLSNVTSDTSQVLPDTAVSANMLIGDTTGDKTVNNADVTQTRGQVGMPVTASNFREDVNINGTITSADVSLVKSDLGHSLP
jgi:serine protease AprX